MPNFNEKLIKFTEKSIKYCGLITVFYRFSGISVYSSVTGGRTRYIQAAHSDSFVQVLPAEE